MSMSEKPRCKLIGEDGNVFSIIGKVTSTLKRHDMKDKAKEFQELAFNAESYYEVLQKAMEYVDVY